MQSHEYSVLNHSRSSIGRYIGAIAATLAAASVGVATATAGYLSSLGLSVLGQNLVGAALSASIAYMAIHWAFDKFGWKRTCWFMRFPNIDGIWACVGETRADDGSVTYNWAATITISQTWEKLRIHLQTNQSASNSVSAALVPEPDGGWILLYSYRNEPRVGEPPELESHLGYCEMHFRPGLKAAEGDYFTARGRRTSGRMALTRKN